MCEAVRDSEEHPESRASNRLKLRDARLWARLIELADANPDAPDVRRIGTLRVEEWKEFKSSLLNRVKNGGLPAVDD